MTNPAERGPEEGKERGGAGRETIFDGALVVALAVLAGCLAVKLTARNTATFARSTAMLLGPLAALAAASGLRAFCCGNRAPSASARMLWPWGLAGVLAGIAAFTGIDFVSDSTVSAAPAAVAAALAMLTYFFLYLAYAPGKSATLIAAASALYVALSAGLGALPQPGPTPSAAGSLAAGAGPRPEADRVGLLSGGGNGVSFEKAELNGDMRDAAVIRPGGYLVAQATVGAQSSLSFAAGARQGERAAGMTVTAVANGRKVPLWKAGATEIREGRWAEARVPISFEGKAKILFEAAGGQDDGPVLVANPRVVTPQPPGGRRPNVILVIADALRPDRLGTYGYARSTSPEIDQLAERGVVFEECLSQAPWTAPSVGTLFTGLHPGAHGLASGSRGLSPSLATLAERLEEAGYETCSMQTNALLVPNTGIAQGFGQWVTFPIGAQFYGKKVYAPGKEVMARGLEWIGEHSTEPFFLYLHLMDVHAPYEPPEEFRTFGPEPSDLYDGGIAHLSREFAGFFAGLEERGLLSNTVVVCLADHGEQFLEHGFYGHGNSLTSEELRVPLIFWAPGIKAGARVAERVSLVDVPVTLLSLAGVEPLAESGGRSLVGALGGEALAAADSLAELWVHYEGGQPMVGITTGHWRFVVHNLDHGFSEKMELFDLEKDSAEYVNLASRYPDMVAEFRKTLVDFSAGQRGLHVRLVPEDMFVTVTKERQEQLRALGYVVPSGNDSRGR
jgi:arylsulfatase A-like enzyme